MKLLRSEIEFKALSKEEVPQILLLQDRVIQGLENFFIF